MQTAERITDNRKTKLFKGLWIARVPFVILFLAALLWGVLLYVRWNRAEDEELELGALHQRAVEQSDIPDIADPSVLTSINGDYAGWVTVYGTYLDLPVVQGEDNTYYLQHDFYGRPVSSGCLFVDSRVDLALDGNILIHGHNMLNGTMLGNLVDFQEQDFFAKHDIVRWESDGTEEFYQLFAALVVYGDEGDDGYFEIEHYINELDELDTTYLIRELSNRAVYWREINLAPTDRFIFILTSDYSEDAGRLLLCGRRLGG